MPSYAILTLFFSFPFLAWKLVVLGFSLATFIFDFFLSFLVPVSGYSLKSPFFFSLSLWWFLLVSSFLISRTLFFPPPFFWATVRGVELAFSAHFPLRFFTVQVSTELFWSLLIFSFAKPKLLVFLSRSVVIFLFLIYSTLTQLPFSFLPPYSATSNLFASWFMPIFSLTFILQSYLSLTFSYVDFQVILLIFFSLITVLVQLVCVKVPFVLWFFLVLAQLTS